MFFRSDKLTVKEMVLRLAESGKTVGSWLAAASFFWVVLLLFDWFCTTSNNGGVFDSLPILLLVSLKLTVLGSAAVGLLHLVRLLLRTTTLSHVAFPLGATLVCGIAAMPLWRLAEAVTSGDWISSRAWAPLLRGGTLIFFFLSVLLGLRWHWQIVCKPMDTESARRRWKDVVLFRLSRRSLFLSGIVFFSVGYAGIAFGFHGYVHLTYLIVAMLWLVGASVLYSLVASMRRGRHGIAVAIAIWLIAVTGVSAHASVRQNQQGISAGRLTALTAMLVHPSGSSIARFDLSHPERWHCSPHEASTEDWKPWPGKSGDHRNVILISSEALRRDMVGKKVKGRPLLPRIEKFKKKSRYFSHAIATYPATLFSVGGVLTGLMPSEILFSPTLPKNIFSITQKLFQSQSVYLPRNIWFKMAVIRPLFVQTAKLRMEKTSQRQTDRLIAHLERMRKRKKRTIAWIHYYDPHSPYERHEEFDFGGGKKNAYFSEVAFTDNEMGRLFDYLEEDGWLDDTLVVVFGDHGQGLGERGYFGHHVYLTSWLTDVPILMHAPGIKAGVSDASVILADIAPTILHFLGQRASSMSAKSLLVRDEGAEKGDYMIAEAFPLRGTQLFKFAQTPITGLEDLVTKMKKIQKSVKSYSPKVAVIDGDWRLIVDRTTDARELYRSTDDPKNIKNLYNKYPQRAADYEAFMQQWHEEMARRFYCDAVTIERHPGDELENATKK